MIKILIHSKFTDSVVISVIELLDGLFNKNYLLICLIATPVKLTDVAGRPTAQVLMKK